MITDPYTIRTNLLAAKDAWLAGDDAVVGAALDSAIAALRLERRLPMPELLRRIDRFLARRYEQALWKHAGRPNAAVILAKEHRRPVAKVAADLARIRQDEGD